MRYIVVTGGVLSGLGKGIASASIAKLMQNNYGLKIVPIKCDGYLNTDPGTMNPIEHGEVYVMDDGYEADMDFGHYERFLNISTKREWNLTNGKILKAVIEKERKGSYLGKTVQFIPHVTNEIIMHFRNIPKKEKADLAIIEIGGTIGDMENMLFLEAARQLKLKDNKVVFIHLSYIPFLKNVGELKSKPTQQSVHLLMQKGISPDFILGRAEINLNKKIKEKIAMHTNLSIENIISAPDVKNIYEIPLNFQKEELDKKIAKILGVLNYKNNMQKWKMLVEKMNKAKKRIKISIAGKYTALQDSYVSIIEAIKHSSAHLEVKPEIELIETSNIEKVSLDTDAVIIPGGFGSRGIEGKIKVIEYCRKNKIPLLGICYGLQLAVIEFSRNVLGIKDANSTEIDENTKHPVIDILPEQKNIKEKGGTMRLGSYKAIIKENSKVFNIYNSKIVYERHRHRYEVNPKMHTILEENGLIISGKSPDGRLAEFIELKDHPFFVATQAHPELKSRFEEPAPLFYHLIKTALELKESQRNL